MISSLSYAFNDDFDYRAYLEMQSHFDRVQLGVRSEIKSLAISNEALAKRKIECLQKINGDVSNGLSRLEGRFESIEFSLDGIKGNLDELVSIASYGFSEVNFRLANIGDKLDSLVLAAKTPDQTWANEQYLIAYDAFGRFLFEEALDYIDRAIFGYGDRSGYRMDWRFHFLRGTIHLGSRENFDRNIVDLSQSRDDFLVAGKYSLASDKIASARSFGMAGWAAYCNGYADEAASLLRKSIGVNSADHRSHYDLAKVLFHSDSSCEARKHFDLSIRGNPFFALSAACDLDFLKHRTAVKDIIKKYSYEIRENIKNSAFNYKLLTSREVASIVLRTNDPFPKESYYSICRQAHKIPSTLPLVDLVDLSRKYFEEIDKGKEAAATRIRELEAERNRLSAAKDQQPAGAPTSLANKLGIAGAAIGVIAAFMEFIAQEHNRVSSAAELIFGAIAVFILGGFIVYGIFGAIGGGIGYVVGFMLEQASAAQKAAISSRERAGMMKSLSNKIDLLKSAIE